MRIKANRGTDKRTIAESATYRACGGNDAIALSGVTKPMFYAAKALTLKNFRKKFIMN